MEGGTHSSQGLWVVVGLLLAGILPFYVRQKWMKHSGRDAEGVIGWAVGSQGRGLARHALLQAKPSFWELWEHHIPGGSGSPLKDTWDSY